MITTCVHVNTHAKQIDFGATLFHLRDKGYIRKSELQTLVDEAEEMLKNILIDANHQQFAFIIRECICQCVVTVQALKKDHPEFKK